MSHGKWVAIAHWSKLGYRTGYEDDNELDDESMKLLGKVEKQMINLHLSI